MAEASIEFSNLSIASGETQVVNPLTENVNSVDTGVNGTASNVSQCPMRVYVKHVANIKLLNNKYYEQLLTDPEAQQRLKDSSKMSVDEKKQDPDLWELEKAKKRVYARDYRARKRLESKKLLKLLADRVQLSHLATDTV